MFLPLYIRPLGHRRKPPPASNLFNRLEKAHPSDATAWPGFGCRGGLSAMQGCGPQ